jgi:hypothetical protein
MNAPVNLPALLEALPPDSTRPQQTEFTRERQTAFLAALADGGAVRRAVKAARISHQTAYRLRRASPAFRLAWDAALLAARAMAEDVLACRALEGVEEKVFYHGEEVATRTRYSDRLLLAHLARLDRLVENARVNAFAEDFEEALARFERGEEQPEPVEAAPPEGRADAGGFSSPGQCNNRSMSPPEDEPGTGPVIPREEALRAIPCDCPGARHGTDGGALHWRMTGAGPQPVCNFEGEEGPCCDTPEWPACRDCPHLPPVARAMGEMEEARPADAPPLRDLGPRYEVEEYQLEAFQAGDPAWWRIGEGGQRFALAKDGGWYPEEEDEAA